MAHKGSAMEMPHGIVGLPFIVATPSDVGRVLTELEIIDNNYLQKKLGGKDHTDQKLSSMLEQTASLNKIDLSKAEGRHHLESFLTAVRKKAPVLHFSFSAEPSGTFLEKLIAWLRQEIHPLTIVTVGLQPTIGAGCVIRSTNKYFELSLRNDFAKNKGLLLKTLGALHEAQTGQLASTQATAQPNTVSRSAAQPAHEVHA